MKEYIFYTTEGYTLPPKENESVENCQVLGRAFGKDVDDAKKQLMDANSWIKDCGFSMDNSIQEQLLTEENKRDIGVIIEYFMNNESRCCEDLKVGNDDIYNAFLRLRNDIE